MMALSVPEVLMSKGLWRLTIPAKIPAAPNPEIALPTMKAGGLGAAPQRAEEASNIRMLVIRTTFTEMNV